MKIVMIVSIGLGSTFALAQEPGLPAQLDRDAIKKGVSTSMRAAKACYQTYHVPGTALAALVIGGSGRVQSVATKGVLAGTPTGNCVAKALAQARFARFSGPAMKVTYPIVLP